MPVARRPTPPPEAIKQAISVMDSLNAWTAKEEDEEKVAVMKAPLNYTPLAPVDKSAPPVGWQRFFDSESDNFNFGIGVVIIVNAIVIGLETDRGSAEFVVYEHIFCIIFVLEMLTRIAQIGLEYFTSIAYLFDCSLVITGALDLWVLPAISGGSTIEHPVGYQFSVMRLLRILRLLRVLRVIRLFRMFGQLLLMVKAFGKALQVVLLLSILVFILIYALAIVFTQGIGHRSQQWGDDADDIETSFGSIPRSMATMFWIMFGSDWDPLLRLLTQVYPTGLVLAFFAFYMIVTIALFALIVGLISESLIFAQQEFKQRTLAKFATKKKALCTEYTEELHTMLEDEMDRYGAVDARDLKQAVKGDSKLVDKLAEVGVSLHVEGLIGLVDSMSRGGKDRVVIEHFIEKLSNLSGNSSASAVVDLKYDLLKSSNHMEQLDRKLDSALAKMK